MLELKVEMSNEDAKELLGRHIAEVLLPSRGMQVKNISWQSYSGLEVTLEEAPPNLNPPVLSEDEFPSIAPPSSYEP